MAKTQITQTGRTVTISYDDALTGERHTREFFSNGAYIQEALENGASRQVFDRLETKGSTLHAPKGNESLIDIIRSEYKSMRSAEKRENAAIGF